MYWIFLLLNHIQFRWLMDVCLLCHQLVKMLNALYTWIFCIVSRWKQGEQGEKTEICVISWKYTNIFPTRFQVLIFETMPQVLLVYKFLRKYFWSIRTYGLCLKIDEYHLAAGTLSLVKFQPFNSKQTIDWFC